ncbi:hypothetical protein [Kitasatospora sp. NPDC058046]|uniref:hypothetical protein n=1 Tax=Kitasatospora sp. NPDC058046 TaxID=3346312 RepID=UPI000670EAB2
MPECAEPGPVAVLPAVVPPVEVLPLWRRGEAGQDRNADRPGVLRGHPGPVAAGRSGRSAQDGQAGRSGQDGRAGAEPAG